VCMQKSIELFIVGVESWIHVQLFFLIFLRMGSSGGFLGQRVGIM